MGNDTSKTEFISIHNNKKSRSSTNQTRQNLTAGTLKLEPIDRRSHYRNQDKRFAKLVREERMRYVSPPIIPSHDGKISGRLPKMEIPPVNDSSSSEISNLTENISSSPSNNSSARPNNWPDPWIALLVRCSAIAPFSEAKESDPLSTADFVSFMLQTITSKNDGDNDPITRYNNNNQHSITDSKNNNNDDDDNCTNSNNKRTGGDLLSPPPPRFFPGDATNITPSQPLHIDEARDSSASMAASEWLVIDTEESRVPFVRASQPWPLEECVICLNMFDRGLNRCGRCHNGVCSSCLLYIVKPVKIDLSNDQNIKAAIRKKKRVVDRVTALVQQEEDRLKKLAKQQDQARRYLERHQQRQTSTSSSSSTLQCDDQFNHHPSLSVSFPKFARMAASAVSDVIDDVRDAVATSFSSPKTLIQQECLEHEDLLQSRRILELLRRTEVTGLFIRPKRNRSSSRRGRDDSGTTTNDDEFDDDDADVGIISSSSATTTTSSSTTNQRNNNNDDDDERPARDEKLKRDNLLCGKHHWSVPVAMEFDDCSESKQSILEKVRLIVQKSIRVESRGICPMCQANPAIWYFAGRKLRSRMLYELMQQSGADPRILEVFAEVSEEEEKEKKRMVLSSSAANGGNGNSSNNPANRNEQIQKLAGADSVWVLPTEAEDIDYQLCIALALSSVVSAYADTSLNTSPVNHTTATTTNTTAVAQTTTTSSSSAPSLPPEQLSNVVQQDSSTTTISSNPTSKDRLGSNSRLPRTTSSPFKSSNLLVNDDDDDNLNDDIHHEIVQQDKQNKNSSSSSPSVLAMEKAIQKIEWAKLCKNCGCANWKEYRCRVCRAIRM